MTTRSMFRMATAALAVFVSLNASAQDLLNVSCEPARELYQGAGGYPRSGKRVEVASEMVGR